MKPKCPVPKTLQSWLTEIATGYNDALEALPFAELMGQKASEKDLRVVRDFARKTWPLWGS